MKKIFIINGTGGSGKDTFVSMVAKYAKVLNYSSIDEIKEIAKSMGWDGQKDEKSRKFLSDLKKLSTNYNDMPYMHTVVAAQNFLEDQENEIMFIHIREPEEIIKVVNSLNAQTILVKREDYKNIESNDSDKLVDNYDYDIYIENTTLEDLECKAQNFVNDLKSERAKK